MSYFCCVNQHSPSVDVTKDLIVIHNIGHSFRHRLGSPKGEVAKNKVADVDETLATLFCHAAERWGAFT